MGIFSKTVHLDQATEYALEQQRRLRQRRPAQILLSSQIHKQQDQLDVTLKRLEDTQGVLQKICEHHRLHVRRDSAYGIPCGSAPGDNYQRSSDNYERSSIPLALGHGHSTGLERGIRPHPGVAVVKGFSGDGIMAGAAPLSSANCQAKRREGAPGRLGTADDASAPRDMRDVQARATHRRGPARRRPSLRLRKLWDTRSLATFYGSLNAEAHKKEKELCKLHVRLRDVGGDPALATPSPATERKCSVAGSKDVASNHNHSDDSASSTTTTNSDATLLNDSNRNSSTPTTPAIPPTSPPKELPASPSASPAALAAARIAARARSSNHVSRPGKNGTDAQSDAQPAPTATPAEPSPRTPPACTKLFHRAVARLKRMHDADDKVEGDANGVAGGGKGAGVEGGEGDGFVGEGKAGDQGAGESDGAVEGKGEEMQETEGKEGVEGREVVGFEAVVLALVCGAAVAAMVAGVVCFLRSTRRYCC